MAQGKKSLSQVELGEIGDARGAGELDNEVAAGFVDGALVGDIDGVEDRASSILVVQELDGAGTLEQLRVRYPGPRTIADLYEAISF